MQPSNAPDLGTWSAGPGLLTDYERLWIETSDAPRVYHVAAAIAVIAGAVENRVYLPFGGERVYPNTWNLILGPSSFFRKSTCISKGRKTLAKANPDALLPDEFSREALLKKLASRGQGLLTYSEFSGALATFGKDYMSGTKELLTDLYDCPATYSRVVGQNEFKASGICLSILAASQTGWFLEKLKGGDVRGGFIARFSFWPAFEKKRFIAIPPEPDMQLYNDIVMRLRALTQIRQQACRLGQGVQARYTTWLERHERELHGHPRCEDLSPFWSRLSIMTLKFAMVLQLSKDAAPDIELDAMDRAIALTDFLKRALVHLFAEEFAFTKDDQDRQKVLRHIRAKAGILLRDLMRACNLPKFQMERILDTLIAEERVEKRNEGKRISVWPIDEVAEVAAGDPSHQSRLARVK